MRSFIIALILFSILLICIIFNSIYVTKTCDTISELCLSVQRNEDRQSSLSKILDIWKKSKPILEFSIRISETERMSDLIESLNSSVSSQNEAEIQKYCILISDHAKDIAQYERISLSGIF